MAEKKEVSKEITAKITVEKTRINGQLYLKDQTVSGEIAKTLINADKAKEVE